MHAAIELRSGASWDKDALKRSIRDALGPVKTPKHIHVFAELPRSPVGKVLKPAIRDEIILRASTKEEAL